jgi:hypothetical protein
VARKRRGPLTGIDEPAWDASEPWQVQQTRRVVQGFARDSAAARTGRRILLWCTLAAIGVGVLAAIVQAIF